MEKLGTEYRHIPPIEEAVNSLQRFLQEDFPKLLRDIDLSTSGVSPKEIRHRNLPAGDSCGSFSVLPVRPSSFNIFLTNIKTAIKIEFSVPGRSGA